MKAGISEKNGKKIVVQMDEEMRKIEVNLMALLMAKGVRDKKLPAEELKVLKTFVEKYPTHHPSGEFYVVNPKEIDKVRAFFRRQNFVGTKGHDFELWDKCIELIRAKKRLMREDIKEIALIRDKMNLPKQRKKRYRDVNAILEIWDKEYKERAKRGKHYQKPPK